MDFELNLNKDTEVGFPLRNGTHKTETCIVALSSAAVAPGAPVFLDSDTSGGTTVVKSAETGEGVVKGVSLAKERVHLFEGEKFEPGEMIEVRTFGEIAVSSTDNVALGDEIFVVSGKFSKTKSKNRAGFVKNTKTPGTDIFILDIQIDNNVNVASGFQASPESPGGVQNA